MKDPKVNETDQLYDNYQKSLKKFTKLIRSFVCQSEDKLNDVLVEHQEDEHKNFHEVLKKELDRLTGTVGPFIERFLKSSREFAFELPTLHALKDPKPGDRIQEKEEASKEDYKKHAFVLAACIGVIKMEVEKWDDFLRKKLSVNHKEMDHPKVMDQVREFAEYIDDALERLICMEKVFAKLQNDKLKEIFGTN